MDLSDKRLLHAKGQRAGLELLLKDPNLRGEARELVKEHQSMCQSMIDELEECRLEDLEESRLEELENREKFKRVVLGIARGTGYKGSDQMVVSLDWRPGNCLDDNTPSLFWDAVEAADLMVTETQESVFDGYDETSVDQMRDALVAVGCTYSPELGKWYQEIQEDS